MAPQLTLLSLTVCYAATLRLLCLGPHSRKWQPLRKQSLSFMLWPIVWSELSDLLTVVLECEWFLRQDIRWYARHYSEHKCFKCQRKCVNAASGTFSSRQPVCLKRLSLLLQFPCCFFLASSDPIAVRAYCLCMTHPGSSKWMWSEDK